MRDLIRYRSRSDSEPAIVTGIIAEKRILMFDEPSGGLDYVHMKTVGKTLRAVLRQP